MEEDESQVESMEGGERKGEINHEDRTQFCWNLPGHVCMVSTAPICVTLAFQLTTGEITL